MAEPVAGEGLRFAVGLFTVLRVDVPRVDGRIAAAAMLWAPAVGAALGSVAGLVAWAAVGAGTSALVAGVLAVGTMAGLTRGLHLDGLADTADGLGCRRPPAEALAVMKASDIGPFGVLSLVLALLLQAAAFAGTAHDARVVAVGALAGAAGRLALPWACRQGERAARPDGLGALVAGTVAPAAAVWVPAATLAGAGLVAVLTPVDVVRAVVAMAAATFAALAVLRRCRTRFQGITGDVLGALVEVGTTVALVVLAAR